MANRPDGYHELGLFNVTGSRVPAGALPPGVARGGLVAPPADPGIGRGNLRSRGRNEHARQVAARARQERTQGII